MDTTAFDQQIADLTSSLGDPTRRGIYITIRESDRPLTASEIAELFDIHPNVARHHLDRLTGDGYLTVSTRRYFARPQPVTVVTELGSGNVFARAVEVVHLPAIAHDRPK